MDIYSILQLLCGLAFFLFGMNVMSSNLEKMAGGSLESVLKKVTSNKLLSLTLGIVITAVIQSSSAVTVMLVGLVNSGIIDFSQTISVILGTNVGTTLTGWIMTLMGVSTDEFSLLSLASPKCFVPILAFIGAITRMFCKKEKTKDIGTIMMGFSILMYGMTIMSSSMSSLMEVPEFQGILTMFTNPVLSLLAATIFTGIIQSSSAAIGIFQALALNGALTFNMAFPMVLGANIGTTVTAILSAIGANRDSKRVVYTHLFVNIFGAIIMLIFFGIYTNLINTTIGTTTINEVGIAVIHTLFNVVNVGLFFPTQGLLVKIIEKLIPDNQEKQQNDLLDERLLATPSVAISEVKDVSTKMAYMAEEGVLKALSLIHHYSDKLPEIIRNDENELDDYEDQISTYVMNLYKESLSGEDADRLTEIDHAITNFERLGDHSLNILEAVEKLNKSGEPLSEDCLRELDVLANAIAEIMDMMVICYEQNDLEIASSIEPLEERIDVLVNECKDNHLTRLMNHECSIDRGMIVSDILGDCERISDHCSNIAVSVIQSNADQYNTHQYLNSIKHESDDFKAKYQAYSEKYFIDKQ